MDIGWPWNWSGTWFLLPMSPSEAKDSKPLKAVLLILSVGIELNAESREVSMLCLRPSGC